MDKIGYHTQPRDLAYNHFDTDAGDYEDEDDDEDDDSTVTLLATEPRILGTLTPSPLTLSPLTPPTISNIPPPPFLSSYYAVFTLLGVSMLWAWNMFLAAGTYLLSRLQDSPSLSSSFQSTELTVSTVCSLVVLFAFAKQQRNANYSKRIITALWMAIGVFFCMTLSSIVLLHVSALAYFTFVLLMILLSSAATGLLQNGVFAYMASFGQKKYTQGAMTGNAIAGVLPSLLQIISVLSLNESPPFDNLPQPGGSRPALLYFSTAVSIALVTLLSFLWLTTQERRRGATLASSSAMAGSIIPIIPKENIPLLRMFAKTFYPAFTVFGTFCLTMTYPVFALKIQSIRWLGSDSSFPPLIFQPRVFQPLAFLMWNLGDLSGRLLTAIPQVTMASQRPRLVFVAMWCRLIFIPMYYLCNISGAGGAVIKSDFFYLFLVQYLFGLSNGYLATISMMAGPECVEADEKSTAGAFMTLMLVLGLAIGSLLSFLIS